MSQAGHSSANNRRNALWARCERILRSESERVTEGDAWPQLIGTNSCGCPGRRGGIVSELRRDQLHRVSRAVPAGARARERHALLDAASDRLIAPLADARGIDPAVVAALPLG